MQKTFYDLIKERQKDFYEVIRKDVDHFENKDGLPFLKRFKSLGPNFSNYFKEYEQTTIQRLNSNLKRDGIPESRIQEAIQLQKNFKVKNYISLLTFELCHKKVFKISDNLTKHLMNTSLEIESIFLKLPFESCIFSYTYKGFIKSYCNLLGKKMPTKDCNINVSIVKLTDDMKFVLKLPADARKSLLFNIWLIDTDGSLIDMFSRSLPIQKGKKISDILATDWNIDTVSDMSSSDFDTDEGESFFRGLINTILYLNSNDIDKLERLSPHDKLLEEKKRIENKNEKHTVKERGRLQSIEHKLEFNSTLNFSSVGENLEDIKVKKPSVSNSKSLNTKEQNKRFLVRGHFRSQSHGKNSEKRKLIWIKPYFKGPDMGDIVEKNYSVE